MSPTRWLVLGAVFSLVRVLGCNAAPVPEGRTAEHQRPEPKPPEKPDPPQPIPAPRPGPTYTGDPPPDRAPASTVSSDRKAP